MSAAIKKRKGFILAVTLIIMSAVLMLSAVIALFAITDKKNSESEISELESKLFAEQIGESFLLKRREFLSELNIGEEKTYSVAAKDEVITWTEESLPSEEGYIATVKSEEEISCVLKKSEQIILIVKSDGEGKITLWSYGKNSGGENK